MALKKTRVTGVGERGKFKSGGVVWIGMCECNLKNSNLEAFF